ncbi:MAG: 4-phosphoerythronate dehydrogenase [Bacteroidales bacterium]|nr:4-phosphoerythronate dehydrogenase [Bacteroidales bacterium]
MSERLKVLADDKIKSIKGILESVADISYKTGTEITAADVANVDALLVRTRTRCDETLLKGSSLRAVLTATIGYDHIDTAYCEANNIIWRNAPGCNSASVEQYIASTLAHLYLHSGVSLAGKVIAVVGVGHVGSRVAKLCKALGMKVLLVDPPRAAREGSSDFTSLRDALPIADFVTLHTPLTKTGQDATFHLIGKETVKYLKKGVALINTSRGQVADTSVIKDAIKDGTISHVVVDVWENEPNIDTELLEMATIATPHIAGYSADSKLRATEMTIDAFEEIFGLKVSWDKPQLPPPSEPIIDVTTATTAVDAACLLFSKIYDVTVDSLPLKAEPTAFERLRGNYWPRREIGAYQVKARKEHLELLHQLGVR